MVAGSLPETAEQARVGSWRAVARVLRSTLFSIRQVVDDVVATLVPAGCRSCAGPLERAGRVPVCQACRARVQQDALVACGRCGEAADLDLDMEDVRFASLFRQGPVCRECESAPPDFERAVHYATYRGELRTLLRLLKFHHIPAVAKLLGGRMAETVLKLEGSASDDLLVVAVPLFARAQRRRGFNQSILLASAAVKRLRTLRPAWKLTEAHDVLRRQRTTASSYELSRRGRRRNLAGAFAASAAVQGREVLLIDDILTTGATARECARVLRRAGAAKVWVATLARSQKGALRRQQEAPGELVARWDLAPEKV